MFLASCFSIALASCCHVSRREPKGAERRLLDAKQGQPQHWVRRNRFSWFCPGPSFFLSTAVCRKTASWQQARSAPKHAKKKQLQLVLPGTLLRAVSTKQKLAASKVSPKTRKEEAASVGFARDNTGREARDTTPGGKRRHDPGASVTASDGDTSRQARDWETQGDKRETPRAGVTAADWETQGDKRETGRHRETSRRHDPGAGVTASDCHSI